MDLLHEEHTKILAELGVWQIRRVTHLYSFTFSAFKHRMFTLVMYLFTIRIVTWNPHTVVVLTLHRTRTQCANMFEAVKPHMPLPPMHHDVTMAAGSAKLMQSPSCDSEINTYYSDHEYIIPKFRTCDAPYQVFRVL